MRPLSFSHRSVALGVLASLLASLGPAMAQTAATPTGNPVVSGPSEVATQPGGPDGAAVPLAPPPVVQPAAVQPAIPPAPPPVPLVRYQLVPMESVPVRFEQRPNTSLAIAGGAVLGGVYLLGTIPGALTSSAELMFIPIVGPFAVMGAAAQYPYSSLGAYEYLGLTMHALSQIAGLSMLIAGLVTKKKVALYQPPACVSVALTGTGLAVRGQF